MVDNKKRGYVVNVTPFFISGVPKGIRTPVAGVKGLIQLFTVIYHVFLKPIDFYINQIHTFLLTYFFFPHIMSKRLEIGLEKYIVASNFFQSEDHR